MIKPDYYPLLIFQARSQLTQVRVQLGNKIYIYIKKNFASFGKVLKESEVQVVFFSFVPVGGQNPGKRRRNDQLNGCLCEWCHAKGYGFYELHLWKTGNFYVEWNTTDQEGQEYARAH